MPVAILTKLRTLWVFVASDGELLHLYGDHLLFRSRTEAVVAAGRHGAYLLGDVLWGQDPYFANDAQA